MKLPKRKVPPLHQRPLRTVLHLLICMVCATVFWVLIGMPTPSAEHALRQLERKHFLEPGEILTSVQDEIGARIYQFVRGADGQIRVSSIERYDKLPFLYESYGGGWFDCDALDGVIYFPQQEYVYLAGLDEQAVKVVMDVTFTLDDREHAQTMYGVPIENGVFRMDLNEMLNLAQGKVYDRGDRMTYDRIRYWSAFPARNGLAAFDSYTIRVFDAEEHELNCWSS